MPMIDLPRDEIVERTLAMVADLPEDQQQFFYCVHNTAPWKGYAKCPDAQLASSFYLAQRSLETYRLKSTPPEPPARAVADYEKLLRDLLKGIDAELTIKLDRISGVLRARINESRYALIYGRAAQPTEGE